MGGRETGGGGHIFTTELGASFAAVPYVLILSSEEHTGECLFERLGWRRKKPPICSAHSFICSHITGRAPAACVIHGSREDVGAAEAGASLSAWKCKAGTQRSAAPKSPVQFGA